VELANRGTPLLLLLPVAVVPSAAVLPAGCFTARTADSLLLVPVAVVAVAPAGMEAVEATELPGAMMSGYAAPDAVGTADFCCCRLRGAMKGAAGAASSAAGALLLPLVPPMVVVVVGAAVLAAGAVE
jgi:hypothetical protein